MLKANYGLFWHNPGVGVGSDANPNTTAKSATYTWNDLNGDRRWQAGEEGTRTAQALAGADRPRSGHRRLRSRTKLSVWLERQLTETMGIRAGYVYKTEDNLIGIGVPGRDARNGAYSVPFPYNDIGADNVRGTADDQVITLHGMPTALAGNFPLDQVVENLPAPVALRHGGDEPEPPLQQQVVGVRSAAPTPGLDDFVETVANSYPRNANLPGQTKRTTWNLKATGSYDAAWGIRISPVMRHQSGINFAREISVPASAAPRSASRFPTSVIYADDPKDNRQDNIWVFDVRAEKTVNMGSRMRTRLFLDFFNIAQQQRVGDHHRGDRRQLPASGERFWDRAPRASDSASSGRTRRRFRGSGF